MNQATRLEHSRRQCIRGMLAMIGVASITWSLPAAHGQIAWRSGPADIAASTRGELVSEMERLAGGGEDRHVVVQLAHPVTPADREKMQDAGLNLLSYVGSDAFFATLSAANVDIPALSGMQF